MRATTPPLSRPLHAPRRATSDKTPAGATMTSTAHVPAMATMIVGGGPVIAAAAAAALRAVTTVTGTAGATGTGDGTRGTGTGTETETDTDTPGTGAIDRGRRTTIAGATGGGRTAASGPGEGIETTTAGSGIGSARGRASGSQRPLHLWQQATMTMMTTASWCRVGRPPLPRAPRRRLLLLLPRPPSKPRPRKPLTKCSRRRAQLLLAAAVAVVQRVSPRRRKGRWSTGTRSARAWG